MCGFSLHRIANHRQTPGIHLSPISPPTIATVRPRWMTALALFCAATVAFLAARDVFVPHVRDVEVWFGFELRGQAARLTAPLHWAIFALGAWGFWRARPWIVPAAAGYAFYVALSHVVWNLVSANGHGWMAGVAEAAAISVPGWLLVRAYRSGGLRPPA